MQYAPTPTWPPYHEHIKKPPLPRAGEGVGGEGISGEGS